MSFDWNRSGDLTDATNLIRIVQQVKPDEIYNPAAQSHVAVSFEKPQYIANSDAPGTLRLLEAIRILQPDRKTRFYRSYTSELCDKVREIPQKETTPYLSVIALRRSQGLRPLDHGELSRGVRLQTYRYRE